MDCRKKESKLSSIEGVIASFLKIHFVTNFSIWMTKQHKIAFFANLRFLVFPPFRWKKCPKSPFFAPFHPLFAPF